MSKAGVVSCIRLNPVDAMSVIDILDHLGLSKDNLSFPQATKLVLGAFLATARRDGIIPVRASGEFEDMLSPFGRENFSGRAAKLRMTGQMSMPVSDSAE